MRNNMKVTVKNGVLKFSCKLKKSQTFKIFENKKYKAVYVFNRQNNFYK